MPNYVQPILNLMSCNHIDIRLKNWYAYVRLSRTAFTAMNAFNSLYVIKYRCLGIRCYLNVLFVSYFICIWYSALLLFVNLSPVCNGVFKIRQVLPYIQPPAEYRQSDLGHADRLAVLKDLPFTRSVHKLAKLPNFRNHCKWKIRVVFPKAFRLQEAGNLSVRTVILGPKLSRE